MKEWNSCVRITRLLLGVAVGLAACSQWANATPVTNAFTLRDVDWTYAAIGGTGGGCGVGGSGDLMLSGVTGPVTHAYLYWHGIDNAAVQCVLDAAAAAKAGGVGASSERAEGSTCDGVYDNPTVVFNGAQVTGVSLGDATTNCWGAGSSRAFRADVTSLVSGNGTYSLSGLVNDPCDDSNGASLIVTYDDGNVLNNRDLVFYEGNDSNISESFPGETDGWHATLAGIHFIEGTASVQLHVADGQAFDPMGLDDNSLTFSAGGTPIVIPDAFHRYDGDSTPDAGFSRSTVPGALWDVHTFDLTPLFTSEDTYTLSMDGQDPFGDCLGLVVLLVNLEAGSAPVPTLHRSWGSVKSIYR